jgi:hypothetical protein
LGGDLEWCFDGWSVKMNLHQSVLNSCFSISAMTSCNLYCQLLWKYRLVLIYSNIKEFLMIYKFFYFIFEKINNIK